MHFSGVWMCLRAMWYGMYGNVYERTMYGESVNAWVHADVNRNKTSGNILVFTLCAMLVS